MNDDLRNSIKWWVDKTCQCKFSDAWRCAVDQNLHRISCDCECHHHTVLDMQDMVKEAQKELHQAFAFAPKVLVKEKKYFRRIRPEVL